MATKKKKAKTRTAGRKTPRDMDAIEREPGTTRSGLGDATTEHPEGSYASLADMPDYHRGFAHPDAESWVIVPHAKEDEAIKEGVSGRWTNSRDGHFVVSVGVDHEATTDEDSDEDSDEDEDEDA